MDEQWPDMDAEPVEWVKYGLGLIREEVDCTLRHVESGGRTEQESDYHKAAMHLQNLATGLTEIAAVLFTRILDEKERLSLIIARAEQDLEAPVEAVKLGDGVYQLKPQEIVVPPNVDELFKEG